VVVGGAGGTVVGGVDVLARLAVERSDRESDGEDDEHAASATATSVIRSDRRCEV
jgi:hypothetical protein